MEAIAIAAIVELAKLVFSAYMSIMRNAGLNEEQIDEAFNQAKSGLYSRNPNDIPN